MRGPKGQVKAVIGESRSVNSARSFDSLDAYEDRNPHNDFWYCTFPRGPVPTEAPCPEALTRALVCHKGPFGEQQLRRTMEPIYSLYVATCVRRVDRLSCSA